MALQTPDHLHGKKTIHLTGDESSYLSFLLSRMDSRGGTIIFYESDDEAFLLEEEIRYFTGRFVYLFPLFAERIFGEEDEARRASFLYHLAISANTFIGLFPYSALSSPVTPLQTVSKGSRTIRTGDNLFQEELVEFLEDAGYQHTPLVREVGEYGKRGSIVDIFPPTDEKPIRIEFMGDDILSVRFFDPVTQRSLEELKECVVTRPHQDQDRSAATVLDYCREDMFFVHKGHADFMTHLEGDARASLKMQWGALLEKARNIVLSPLPTEEPETSVRAVSNRDLRLLFESDPAEVFVKLSEKMKQEWSERRHVYVFTHNDHQGKRLQEIFGSYGLHLPLLSGISTSEKEREWGIINGPLRRGFRTDDIIVLTEEDIVGRKKRSVKTTRWSGMDEFLSSFKDLAPGDWVVHTEHGIGVYKGILPLTINGHIKDFILIEYQDGDKLYVPVDDLHLVQKFIGSEKFKPKIDRLGSPIWKNTKKKVRKQIEDIAGELLEIYAGRQLAEGYAYSPEDELFREMESRFEFEETEGQLNAIEETLQDLKNLRPMDRLVCGDVGFGKTEVALRAAFKVVLDNRQVAILVPTTVLAQQHYRTFCARLRDYPVNIGVLSRFRTRQEQLDTLERLKKGDIDVIIGTHRILQKDMAFRDLGLIIIDEEQRFGVKHKERLKLYRKDVDVLTLSATPIPRTLYMATMGIKDLSIISTPPLDRMAVKTCVVQFSDKVIAKGVLDELRRGGQVFFVHNYVHNIGVVLDHLSRLLPHVRIAVAHGQMEGRKLEKIMLDFIEKRYDLLLSTNIIESGLDISNVNTIFINNAHRMGLSDLYQLRGRVGRSEKQAYAYLLVPKDAQLTRDAALRLRIIEELTELGSGFHIANYDLEIRGAGNLLGKEQSGNINLIGFELYCTMLEETIQSLKEKPEKEPTRVTTEVNIAIDAYIPEAYIPDPSQRLLMYKRLSKADSNNELNDLREEFKDRYGSVPEPLANLFEIISLKSFLSAVRIKKLEYSGKQVVLHVTDETPIHMDKMLQKTLDPSSSMKLMADGRIVITTDRKGVELIYFIRNTLNEITAL